MTTFCSGMKSSTFLELAASDRYSLKLGFAEGLQSPGSQEPDTLCFENNQE
jgi:hypothetical protein